MDTDNKYGTLEIQKILLVLLKEFDAFCQEEGIRYSLCSGSLLGAVRHKGFIPWDDDIDCIMDRDNFNKFKKAISNHEKLVLENCTKSALWIDRVRFRDTSYQGSYQPTLDLLIADNCPDNKIKANIKLLVIKILQGMVKYELSIKKGSLVMRACSLLTYLMGRLFSHYTKYLWYNKVAQWGNKTPTKNMKIYHDQWSALGYIYPSDIIKGQINRMPFEDTMVNGFGAYDRYLRIIYGDNYMVPPQEKERIPYHINK